jgi:hypothetical protein
VPVVPMKTMLPRAQLASKVVVGPLSAAAHEDNEYRIDST